MVNTYVIELHQYEEVDDYNNESYIKIFVQGFEARFEIQYLPRNLKASSYQLAQYNKSLKILALGDAGYNNWDVMNAEEEVNKLKEPFRALMDSLLIEAIPSNCTTRDYLQATVYILEAKCNGDTLLPTLKGQLPRQVVGLPGSPLKPIDDWLLDTFNYFTPSQIHLIPTSSELDQHPCLKGPSVIRTNTKCYFKPLLSNTPPGKDWVHKRVMDAFDAGKLPSTMPICRIKGIVVIDIEEVLEDYEPVSEAELIEKWGYTEDDVTIITNPKCMLGFVLSYIKNKGTLYDIALWEDCSNDLRLHWANELEGLVHQLHTMDLIWGDAKPQNILIDLKNRLWLIDLDGGYTPGWVEKENEEIQTGDWQGVKRIKEWLLECGKSPFTHRIHSAL
ncbi:uncharacterized protein EAE98_012302 [Botrytis deweyae]|uniref:Protein kinase domain-containing protein n=1 Tax=Botrytis deweyae TaxID=2478750 RepID=A0ABQ7I3A7_9HELO|nr:uncharacterized protein EAE98_012302 [Botrytis deweyae]KAF7909090.1 hypothetical protein EAE98_012302 [Botrytis deweyae]